jgi:hypothetical protein
MIEPPPWMAGLPLLESRQGRRPTRYLRLPSALGEGSNW